MEIPKYKFVRVPRNFDDDTEADSPMDINWKNFRVTFDAARKHLREITKPTVDGTDLYNESRSWHLSLNHKCIKWLPLEKKKKRKLKGRTNDCRHPALLVLGTGSDDVSLVLPASQLKWRTLDCHPESVCAISFSADRFTCMSCQTDPAIVSLMGKFRASTKAISCMVLAHDGKILARPVESF